MLSYFFSHPISPTKNHCQTCVRCFSDSELKYRSMKANLPQDIKLYGAKKCVQEVWVRSSTGRRGYIFLLLPATTFCLGCWQWKRHLWKTDLLSKMNERTNKRPVELPADLSTLDNMEYQKVHLKGTYLYDRQFAIKWRSRLDREAKRIENEGQGRSFLGKHLPPETGSQIITPMLLDGRNLTVMVNRGWLPAEKVSGELLRGQTSRPSHAELDAIVRKSEKPSFFMRNDPFKGVWMYKDLQQMGQFCEAAPILLDAVFESSDPDSPIGGQTNVNLRNEHLNYMLQWFAMTGIMLGFIFLRNFK